MCGEKAVFDMCSCHSLGSPPHVRGKVACKVQAVCYEGITPACAGKSQEGFSRCPSHQDHPRMCGEKGAELYSTVLDEGSPPHVRGKAGLGRPASELQRITPACAGKSQVLRACLCCLWDHPHMCGEKEHVHLQRNRTWGSPPHVRGKGTAGNDRARNHGITPACAGKSMALPSIAGIRGDHPRMCGEKRVIYWDTDSCKGSPPHVRGKDAVNQAGKRRFGITPACAGKRMAALITCEMAWDHPRMCGEKTKKIP